MNGLLNCTAKIAIGTCVILCAATVVASMTVGKDLGRVVLAGFNGAKGAIKKELAVQKLKSSESIFED